LGLGGPLKGLVVGPFYRVAGRATRGLLQ
jgi:hypothetical protein